MLCTCLSRTKIETYHLTFPNMGGSKSGRLSRWLILLAEFDLKYMARKTIRKSIVSNFCVENSVEGEDGKEDFLDEYILGVELGTWKMYFDRAINQYGNGIGILLITLERSHIPLAIKLKL